MAYMLVVEDTDATWIFTKEIHFVFHATRTIEIEIKLINYSNLQ